MSRGYDLYLWRQCLILLSDYLHCLGIGFMLTFPSILNPAILSPNSEINATPDQASWIAACQGITGVVGFISVPALMQAYGRKAAHYAINSFVVIGFIIFYFATNCTQLYIARLIQGLALCGVYITSIIIAEYSDPKRRGYFISVKKSAVALGSLICHLLIVFCTWRHIALIGAISNILAIVLTVKWPESPPYLAMKGKFDECDKSHAWLFGNSSWSRQDVEDMVAAQTEIRKERYNENIMIRIWKKFRSKHFLKPFLISTILTVATESCGRYYNIAYMVQIMTDILKDKSAAIYCSIGSDILTLAALWSSCFVITRFKRRTILFAFGFASVAMMFLISLTIFSIKNSYIGGLFVWLPPVLIIVNSFVTNLGILPICFTISGEIYPLEHRGVGSCVSGVLFTVLYAVVLKCIPSMMDKTGVHGTYAIFGATLLISLIVLHFILNETKDKTLQEIEDEIKDVNRNKLLILEQGVDTEKLH